MKTINFYDNYEHGKMTIMRKTALYLFINIGVKNAIKVIVKFIAIAK